MFAVLLSNYDPPDGARMVAQYAMAACDCAVSLVELRAPLSTGSASQSLNAATLEEGLELARCIAIATSAAAARSGS